MNEVDQLFLSDGLEEETEVPYKEKCCKRIILPLKRT